MSKEDSQDLYNRLFKTVTEHLPMEPMTVRTDLVMDLYQDFHKWATGEADEVHGVNADVVEIEYDAIAFDAKPVRLAPGTVDDTVN